MPGLAGDTPRAAPGGHRGGAPPRPPEPLRPDVAAAAFPPAAGSQVSERRPSADAPVKAQKVCARLFVPVGPTMASLARARLRGGCALGRRGLPFPRSQGLAAPTRDPAGPQCPALSSLALPVGDSRSLADGRFTTLTQMCFCGKFAVWSAWAWAARGPRVAEASPLGAVRPPSP